MPLRTRHFIFAVVALLLGFGLGGCGTINEKLAGSVSDAIPAWAGGLPPDETSVANGKKKPDGG